MTEVHPRATTNRHTRTLIQSSSESVRVLAKRFGLNPKTIQKWKSRDSVSDKKFGTKTVRYTLSKTERRIIALVRKHLKVELDELVVILEPYMPKINRSNCYRVLVKYRLNRLPKEIRKIGKYANYLPGYLHIDVAFLPKIGKSPKRKYLFVAIDRVNRLAFIVMTKDMTKETAVIFLERVIAYYPYHLHRILTDNGGEFTYAGMPNKLRPRNKEGEELEHPFTKLCRESGILHKRTKFRHPWTNGMVERMNGRIKKATVKKFRYESYEQLANHLTKFMNTYNLKTKLKSLGKRTPFEKVQEYRIERPDKFYDSNKDLERIAVCTTT